MTQPSDRTQASGERPPRLRLGHSLEHLPVSHATGPGRRVALFVQGCRLRCTRDCLNPGFLEPGGGHEVGADQVVGALERVLGEHPAGVEGLTVLGGEPTEQAEALVPVLEAVRHRGLTVMLYSGHTLEALQARADPWIDRLLAVSDLLVDGPYLSSRASPAHPWRGSENQRLHRLSGRYSEQELAEAARRQRQAFSILGGPDGTLSLVGLRSRRDADRAESVLGTGSAPRGERVRR